MMKIKRDDNVIVISGKDKGKNGKVLSVKDDYVVVKGVNLRTKNIKPTKAGEKGKRDILEFPIHISNVMYYDEKAKSPMKVAFTVENDKKVRVFKKTRGAA